MGTRLGCRVGEASAEVASALSRAALDAPLVASAELSILTVTSSATLCGAFQRRLARDTSPVYRRASGGANVLVGVGTVHVLLALERPDALGPCPPNRLVNRHVRPILRALTASGAPAAFFDRDWIAVAKEPAGAIGFAHDASTGRAVVEAFLAVRAPFAQDVARATFRAKAPRTIEAITARSIALEDLAERIRDAYVDEHGAELVELDLLREPGGDDADLAVDPPWAAEVPVPIGFVAAGNDAHGVLRVGGDLLASRDAITEVARRAASASEGEVGALVDEVFRRPGVLLDGVRDLGAIRDAIVAARRRG